MLEQEFQPRPFSLTFDFDWLFEFVIDCVVLTLNEVFEIFGSPVELELPSDGFEEDVETLKENKENT